MYSRRFSDGEMPLPPDYGGVALRAGEKKEEQQEKETEDEMNTADRRQTRRQKYDRRAGENGGRMPRRPLYEQSCKCEKPRYGSPAKTTYETDDANAGGEYGNGNRGGERREQREKNAERGLFGQNLFSFGGRSFRTEDIILAGLILLLMNDRTDGKEPDGQLLLILGLLLLTK